MTTHLVCAYRRPRLYIVFTIASVCVSNTLVRKCESVLDVANEGASSPQRIKTICGVYVVLIEQMRPSIQ